MEFSFAVLLFLFALSQHATAAEPLEQRRQLSDGGHHHFYYHTHYADGNVSPEIIAFRPSKGKGKGKGSVKSSAKSSAKSSKAKEHYPDDDAMSPPDPYIPVPSKGKGKGSSKEAKSIKATKAPKTEPTGKGKGKGQSKGATSAKVAKTPKADPPTKGKGKGDSKSVKATKTPKAAPPSKGDSPSKGKGKGAAKSVKATKTPKAKGGSDPKGKGKGATPPSKGDSPAKGKGSVKAAKSPKSAKASDHVTCVAVPTEDECCYCECCHYPEGKGKGGSSKASSVKAPKATKSKGKGGEMSGKGKGKGTYRLLMETMEDFPPENCSCACDEQCSASTPTSPSFEATAPTESPGDDLSSSNSSVVDGSTARTTDSIADVVETDPDIESGAEDTNSDVGVPSTSSSSRTIFPWLMVGVVGSCLSLYLLKRARSAGTVDDTSLSV